jgi:hypothetical protein
MKETLNLKRYRNAIFMIVFLYAINGPAVGQNLGVNFNEFTGRIDVGDLDRTETTWMRVFIDYFDYKEGRLNINTNEGLAKLEAAKAAGYKVILSLKFDFTGRNFPTGTATIDADLSYVPTILNRLYNDADIIVAGNEPFIESLQKGTNLVEYYKRAAIAVSNYRNGQTRKVPIYIGAFNRLWLTTEQTQAVVDYLTFARNNTWIAGADLHIHHDDIHQITTAMNFVNSRLRSDQKMLVTEFSLMKHWKNNLGQTIPSILNTQYGRPASWKVHEYLNYAISSPVLRPEWVAFLQNSSWFETRKHYLANAWGKFRAFSKFNVATYGMYQTHGGAFTINTDPWILNPLYASQTVEKNPTTGLNQFHYSFIDDFRSIQNGTARIAEAENETQSATINEESKLAIYPNPANQYLNVRGANGDFVILSPLGKPVRKFEGAQTDVADLTPGLYLLRHEQSGQTKVFVKE